MAILNKYILYNKLSKAIFVNNDVIKMVISPRHYLTETIVSLYKSFMALLQFHDVLDLYDDLDLVC